jgi:hypothetical protein
MGLFTIMRTLIRILLLIKIYKPSTAQFWSSTPPFECSSTSITPFWASKPPEFWLFCGDPASQNNADHNPHPQPWSLLYCTIAMIIDKTFYVCTHWSANDLLYISTLALPPLVKYGGRSPKFIWAPCAPLYSWAESKIKTRTPRARLPFCNP